MGIPLRERLGIVRANGRAWRDKIEIPRQEDGIDAVEADDGLSLNRAVKPPIRVDEVVQVPSLKADLASRENLERHARKHDFAFSLDFVG